MIKQPLLLARGHVIILELVWRFHTWTASLSSSLLAAAVVAEGVDLAVPEISRRFDSLRVEMGAWCSRVAKQ